MQLDIYQIDAFSERVFSGNPAAVVPLDSWLDDSVMQAIAAENNLAETAFFVNQAGRYHIRWFTPVTEVDLCGHATLASAYVLYRELGYELPALTFDSKSGPLTITQRDDLYMMDFPSQPCTPCPVPAGLSTALGVPISECFCHEDYLVVLDNEAQLTALEPDFLAMSKLTLRGVIVTAVSESYDFVNRFFAPNVGINEDAVTGSAYTKLIPYWAERLAKKRMTAKQVSARGGEVICEIAGERVLIGGKAVNYLQGQIWV